jgi:aarF domain-containing kinase
MLPFCDVPVQIVDPQVDHLNISGTRDEKNMLQGYAAIYAKQIGDLLLRMPRPLLLLLKTNDCLRSVDLSLGAPVNTFVITAKTCSRALAELDGQQRRSVGSWLSGRLEVLRVDLAMTVMQLLGFWASVQRALGLKPAGPAAAAAAAPGLGTGGVVYDEQVLQQHREAAAAGVVLSAEAEAAAAQAA